MGKRIILTESQFSLLFEWLEKNNILSQIKDKIERPLIDKEIDNLKKPEHLSYFAYWLSVFKTKGDESTKLYNYSEKIQIEDYEESQKGYQKIYNYIMSNYGEYIDEYYSATFGTDSEYSDASSWSYDLMFKNPQEIGSKWLIHFTNNPLDIIRNGIKGRNDLSNLGWTRGNKYYDDYMSNEGIIFAYDPNELKITNGIGYGEYAFLFRSPSLKVFHNFEREYQFMVVPQMIEKNSMILLHFIKVTKNCGTNSNGEIDTFDDVNGVELISLPSMQPIETFDTLSDLMNYIDTNSKNTNEWGKYINGLNLNKENAELVYQKFYNIKEWFINTINYIIKTFNGKITNNTAGVSYEFQHKNEIIAVFDENSFYNLKQYLQANNGIFKKEIGRNAYEIIYDNYKIGRLDIEWNKDTYKECYIKFVFSYYLIFEKLGIYRNDKNDELGNIKL